MHSQGQARSGPAIPHTCAAGCAAKAHGRAGCESLTAPDVRCLPAPSPAGGSVCRGQGVARRRARAGRVAMAGPDTDGRARRAYGTWRAPRRTMKRYGHAKLAPLPELARGRRIARGRRRSAALTRCSCPSLFLSARARRSGGGAGAPAARAGRLRGAGGAGVRGAGLACAVFGRAVPRLRCPPPCCISAQGPAQIRVSDPSYAVVVA